MIYTRVFHMASQTELWVTERDLPSERDTVKGEGRTGTFLNRSFVEEAPQHELSNRNRTITLLSKLNLLRSRVSVALLSPWVRAPC